MNPDWESFWKRYRAREAESDDDLFVQVGLTIDKKPIPREQFIRIIDRISSLLDLDRGDHLLDLCCGNGLISFELARRVSTVTGVDFTEHLLAAAKTWKLAPNIAYQRGNVLEPLGGLGIETKPTKVLMAGALGHFDPEGLRRILSNLIALVGDDPFRFLVFAIPDDARKWNFYDTDERRARYAENVASADSFNDGMGRWWSAAEIVDVAEGLGLSATIEPEPSEISHYRLDAIIERRV